jgi:carboxynorspermidine decarboxylase
MKKIDTPYYLIDESILLDNLKKIEYLQKFSGAKVLLATKCFSTWSVFPLIKKYISGTISSSLYEVKLGHDKIGKETHAYCVGYKPEELKIINRMADKIIFNSVSQFKNLCHNIPISKIGLRINPGVGYSPFELADPTIAYSRLGESSSENIKQVLPYISGAMFHFNCDNEDFDNLIENLNHIEFCYKDVFNSVKWISIGGGISFTSNTYPLDDLVFKLKEISKRNNNIQIYLEPGEAIITKSAQLVTTIVDIVHNVIDSAIIDASTEAHMLDLLTYHIPAKIENTNKNGYTYKYRIAGRSCLSGDIFGDYNFKSPLSIGGRICIQDAAGYTMVKKNWFNGLQMPSIVVKRLSGRTELIKKFCYKDFLKSLS